MPGEKEAASVAADRERQPGGGRERREGGGAQVDDRLACLMFTRQEQEIRNDK